MMRRRAMMQETSGGEKIYYSSTGLPYTAVFTIDLTGTGTGQLVYNCMDQYGIMEHLEDLTLTGVMRYALGNGSLIQSAGIFGSATLPALKRLAIQPTEIRNAAGKSTSDQSYYGRFIFGHYVFKLTNLTELILGRLGGPFFIGTSYFRNDGPTSDKYAVGSADGLTLTTYTDVYRDRAGFMHSTLPTTTIYQYDYLTGELLTN